MIIDGTKIAKDILARAKARAAALAHPPRVVALVANQTAATKSYLKIKSRFAQEAGCTFEIQEFPETVSAAELRSAATSSDVDALLVQLPLPTHLNPQDICNAIPLRKDADVLSGVARAEFEKGESGALLPPVVGAIRETFAFGKIDPKGKRAVVIGEGWLVGNPAAIWLREQGASVEVVTEKSKNLPELLAEADIVVSGAGSPHLIKPEMIKNGVVLVDAGTSESGGQVAGDADPTCASKCSLFTPVPGGLGPVAVACLFENVTWLTK